MRRLGCITRRRRALRRWRQILLRPSSALLFALCLLFAEPLACIIHCQIYVPWLLRHQRVHEHGHAVTTTAAALAAPLGRAPADAAAPLGVPAGSWCFHASGGGSAPVSSAPPSPVHDALLLVILLIVGAAAAHVLAARAPLRPPRWSMPPPTPPPILHAIPIL